MLILWRFLSPRDIHLTFPPEPDSAAARRCLTIMCVASLRGGTPHAKTSEMCALRSRLTPPPASRVSRVSVGERRCSSSCVMVRRKRAWTCLREPGGKQS